MHAASALALAAFGQWRCVSDACRSRAADLSSSRAGSTHIDLLSVAEKRWVARTPGVTSAVVNPLTTPSLDGREPGACVPGACAILSVFTAGVADEWRNLHVTLQRVHLEALMVVFALDQEVLAVAQAVGVAVRTELITATVSRASDYGQRSFQPVVMLKLRAIQLLLREGLLVFYLDTDIVIMRDFVSDYLSMPKHDVYLQSNERHFGRAESHCSGVMFFRPSTAALELLEATVVEFEHCKATSACTDQEALNAAIHSRQQPVGRLDPANYPAGAQYFGVEPTYADPLFFNASARALCSQTPMLVHNNWLIGRANKVIRFRLHGLWFVDGGAHVAHEWQQYARVQLDAVGIQDTLR